MNTVIHYFHLLALVVWLGSIIFFSFVGAPAIFKSLDRNLAGRVVGNIFPTYYVIGYICATIAIITSFLIGLKYNRIEQIKVAILGFMLVLTLIAGLVVLPKAQSIKTEIYSNAKKENKEKLKKQFGKIHGISVILNIITLLGGLVVLYFITYKMKE